MNKLHVSRRTVIGSLGAGLLLTASRGALAAPVTLDALKKAGELRVGCEAAYVPFTYRDNAGKIIGELLKHVDGRGGGKPNYAQDGGKKVAGLGALLRAAPDTVKSLLS